MAEYKLSYTASEIDEKLGKIDNIGWNDLTDKPFYEEGGMEDVLTQQEVTFAPSGQGWIAETMSNIPIVPSDSYLVTWGDDEYNLTAGAFSMQGMDVPYLGNLANLQMGADTGEPFVVMYMEMPNGDEIIRGLLVGGSTAEFGTDPSVTPTKNVAVYHDTTIIKTLDAKYLPMDAIDTRIELYIAEALGGDY